MFTDNKINIRKIIKIFDILTKINTFIKSQRYIYSKKLHENILIN